jgi:glycosyltransferase involved in cell wall biosynthesis
MTGYLVDEASVESLAEGIRRAIAERPAWAELTRRARGWVDTRHSDAAVSEMLEQIHREVAGS